MMTRFLRFGFAVLVLAGFAGAGCGKQDESKATPPAEGSKAPAAAGAVAEQPKAGGIKTSTGIEMVLVPAGSFQMGDEKGEADEKPVHKVNIAAFVMDKYEVTQKNFQALMGKNPSKSKTPEKPVEQVNWFDAISYCNMRSTKEGLETCYDLTKQTCNFDATGYRLPTEAEWEYACRGGTATRYSFGDEASKLGQFGWSKDNSGGAPHPVGQKQPNAFGLYDMHGNISEWCQDFYDKGYYANAPAENPRGPASANTCVLRGGSWNSPADSCRAATRNSETPKFADACFGADTYGFRCVRKPSAGEVK